eukprot:gene26640-biopygen17055
MFREAEAEGSDGLA